ncbi:MAG: hypothetical protein KDB21_00225 [Acidimicrobiales bacterium]|nr:hypothetical protein [Acidimicrobiales bacterium]
MTTDPTPTSSSTRRKIAAVALSALTLTGGAGFLAACGGSSNSGATSAAPTATAAATDTGGTDGTTGSSGSQTGTDQVLPVDANPITNAATTQAFTIDNVLVENNEDASGNAVDDHLEITITNTSSADLTGFEVFYTYDDATDGLTESYYAQLPTDFTVAAGATRVIHFDNTSAPDHFPVNAYSLYYTDVNALDVTVEVSATDAAPQTATVQKDAGGAEIPD